MNLILRHVVTILVLVIVLACVMEKTASFKFLDQQNISSSVLLQHQNHDDKNEKAASSSSVDDASTTTNVALFSVNHLEMFDIETLAQRRNGICRNNNGWRYDMTNHNCDSIRLNDSLRIELCPLEEIQENCPITCGLCCEDDPEFLFQRENGALSECAWLKQKNRRQKRYCDRVNKDGRVIRTACPKSCDYCVDFPSEAPSTLSAATSSSSLSPTTTVKHPNLVVVITDEHNLRTLSCYRDYLMTKFDKDKVDVWGNVSLLSTPNIDSLAHRGALFTNFYTVAPLCTPSRGSFLTGMYPAFTGDTNWNNGRLHKNVTTWATILRDKGYATSYVGKFHLDGKEKPGWGAKEGRDFGFDDNMYRFNRGHWKYFDEVNGTVKEYEYKDRSNFVGRHSKSYATDFLMDRGIEFIENSVEKGRPFAVVISIPDPHHPNENRPYYRKLFKNLDFKVPETARKNLKFDPAAPLFNFISGDKTMINTVDEKIAEYEKSFFVSHMQQYYGMVKCIDHNIGKLLKKLNALSVENDTIVVFTSDHGDLLMEHGKLNKGSPYKTSAGIPFIVQYPAKVPNGKVIETAYSSVDFAPTILNLMGIGNATLSNFQGVDGSEELMRSEHLNGENEHVVFSFAAGKRPRWAAAIKDGLKLVFTKGDIPWLFDMYRDPDELINYATSESHQIAYAQLKDALVDAMIQFQSPFTSFAQFIYLDTPTCFDRKDIVPITGKGTFLCSDIGGAINIGKCNKFKVRQHCPVTCQNCCKDSPGKMWVATKPLGCGSLSIYCHNKLVKTFCPETCNLCSRQYEDVS